MNTSKKVVKVQPNIMLDRYYNHFEFPVTCLIFDLIKSVPNGSIGLKK